MTNLRVLAILAALTAAALPSLAFADEASGAPGKAAAMDNTAVYIILILIGALVLAAFMGIVGKLKRSGTWNLGDAVSEEVAFVTTTAVAGGATTTTTTTKLVASTSRLIALLGMAVIIALFLGVGMVVVWDVAHNCTTNLDGVLHYFLAGASLFVPYAINQIRSGFDSIGK